MLTLYAQLCWVFFYIGLFGFGGGYAMISLIQFEVVNQFGWMNTSEFANLLALSQMTPGPISINTATYVGYTVLLPYGHVFAIAGSVVATIALCLPSVLMMWAVIRFLFRNEQNRYVRYVFSGLRPAVVGLIFSAGMLMMVDCDQLHRYVTGAASQLVLAWKTENFGTEMVGHVLSVIICAATFVSIYFYKKNPILLILLSGLVGFVCYYVIGLQWFQRLM
jgi:chromate transporter